MSRPIVAALAFEGISLFHLSVPSLIFGEDRTTLGLPHFDFRICDINHDTPVATVGGGLLTGTHGLDGLIGADIVIVPSWKGANVPVPDHLSRAIAAAHMSGSLVIGLCLGTFVLAAAGVLSGRAATTHWASTDQLALQYPDIRVRPDVLYVDEGGPITSAGVVASLDCCLHLVRRLYGANVAHRLARQIVLPPHRQGGQAQYIEKPVIARPRDQLVSTAMEHVLADLSRPHSVDSVAAACGLSRRTFTRRFQKQTGSSFSRWLAAQRVSAAQRLLEASDHSIEDVSHMCGFGTTVAMRQHFRATLRTTPNAYRREFEKGMDGPGSLGDELDAGWGARIRT